MRIVSNKIFLFTVVVAAIFALAAILLYVTYFQAPQRDAAPERFTIPKNGIDDIAGELLMSGFIKNDRGFLFALGDPSTIKPGAYMISKSMNAWELARSLRGEPALIWVTFPEGLRKEELAAILTEELGWSDASATEWLAATETSPDFREGIYFPDTYLIPVTEPPEDVAARLRGRFQEKFSPLAQEAIDQNIKWTTAITLASLVQREAAGAGDMPLIAGILWNRLEIGMKLEVDATVQYARGDRGAGWWAPIAAADKQIDSPYNTYRYEGLPPHPIANPGFDAIKAVLFPEKTDCLFYLHADEKIYCSKTYQGHLQNIERYLR
jgi:UPF0755 protein